MAENTLSILKDISFLLTFIITGYAIIEKIKTENKKMFDEIDKKLQESRMATMRRYLVDFLAEIQCGIRKNERQNIAAYETYDEYKKLGGNSYVLEYWESVMAKKPRYGAIVKKAEELNKKHEEEKIHGTTK